MIGALRIQKLPDAITVEDTVRIGSGTLTIGQDRFREAEKLAKAGDVDKAWKALKTLRSEFPNTWIDRAAAKLLQDLSRGGQSK